MIEEFVRAWEERKHLVREQLSKAHPDRYGDLVKMVIETISPEDSHVDYWNKPDPKRIHEIDDGDYQGTLLFVIGAQGYQPDKYWYVKVSYGSCSGCDTLEAIRNYEYGEVPKEKQVAEYMTLALHIVQGLRETSDNDEAC